MPRPKSPNKYRRWVFSLPEELLDRLNAASQLIRSEGQDVSSAEIVRLALTRYLDEFEKKSQNRIPPNVTRRTP